MNFYILFLPSFTPTWSLFGEDNETMNYVISSTFPLPILY